jgi:hypothetical protein
MNDFAMVDQEIVQPSLLPVSSSSVADPFHHLVVVYHCACGGEGGGPEEFIAH